MSPNGGVIFSGPMFTSYSQMHVLSEVSLEPLRAEDAFQGHANGMLGAAAAGSLFVRVGVNTGHLHMTVEVHASPPPIDDTWEEIVEASFTFCSDEIWLEGFDSSSRLVLPLVAGQYRARLCVNGFGKSEAAVEFGDPSLERYALMLWPAPLGPDTIVKVTSKAAGDTHESMRASFAS